MKTNFGFWILTILLLTSAPPAEAQQAKVPKIGLLSSTAFALGGSRDSLLQELRPLGYVEGQNIAIEYRSAGNKLDRLPALAEELVGLKVDVLALARRPVHWLPRMLPGRSPSFFTACPIRLRLA